MSLVSEGHARLLPVVLFLALAAPAAASSTMEFQSPLTFVWDG